MRGPSAQYLSLPFSEAIAFFRQKVTLPTRAWDDLWQGMHSRAFVVAGATKTELLTDLRSAVDKGISSGTTLAEFRRDFDALVEKHGWAYKGGRNWRSAVIYDTNLSVAYATGHHRAMTDPDVLGVRPWFRYLPSSSANPREEHRKWYNLVLRHDDPFWQTHSPPNGWGCHCGRGSLSNGELTRLQAEESSGSYPIRTNAPARETYDYTNRKTGEISKVPVGIDPGWDYNPGDAAWGRQVSDKAMAEHAATKDDAWEALTPGNWQTYGLPEQLAPDLQTAEAGKKVTTIPAAIEALEDIIGGKEKIYSLAAENGYRHDLVVNAEILIRHMDMDNSPYLPLIPETLTDPQEIWMQFERHKDTGKVLLRQRIIKILQLGDGQNPLLITSEAVNGWITSWTTMLADSRADVNKQRTGQLVYSKK